MLKKIVCACILSLLFHHAASALMVKLDLETLTKNANVAVRARVESIRCSWDKDHHRIFTFAILAVTESIKGDPLTSSITVTYPGGKVGDIRLIVEDTPHFRPGEDVVVFLKNKNEEGLREVYGWFQGKYTIENNLVLENRLPVRTFINRIKSIVAHERGER